MLGCHRRYHTLVGSLSANQEAAAKLKKEFRNDSQQIAPDWSILLGENITGLSLGRYSPRLLPGQLEIFAMTETGFFIIHAEKVQTWKKNKDLSHAQTAQTPLQMQKRLNYHPCAVCSYCPSKGREADNIDVTKAERAHNVIIASHSGMLEVYGSNQVLWAARCPIKPYSVAIQMFGELKGLIVLMDREGSLSVCYLGTEPPTGAVGSLTGSTKPLDYAAMEEEHRKLMKKIREAQSDNRPAPRTKLSIRAEVPTRCDYLTGGTFRSSNSLEQGFSSMKISSTEDDKNLTPCISIPLQLNYNGSEAIEDITVSVSVPPSIQAEQYTYTVDRIAGGNTETVSLLLQSSRTGIPSSLTVDVTASYQTSQQEPRISQCKLQLPLAIVCQIVRPIKNPVYKLTINTNQPPPAALSALFSDMLAQSCLADDERKSIEQTGVHVVSFKYYSGADVSILVSKNAGRYRIQGGTLEALWLASSQLVERLKRYSHASGSQLEFTYSEPLPLADFFRHIDSHFGARKRLSALRAELNDRAAQFRAVQKRLIVRFRDRNPAPLSSLDKILSSTHEDLVKLADEAEKCYSEMASCRNQLQCVIRLTALLIKLKYDLSEDDYQIICEHLIPEVDDNNEQGWEERCDAAVLYFLRAYCGESRESSISHHLEMPHDTTELKNHLATLCDRLEQTGGKLKKN